MTAAAMKTDLIPGSADREDIDPTSTSIAFEPCRVDDALPAELVDATYDRAAERIKSISAPGFTRKLHALRPAQPQRLRVPRPVRRRIPATRHDADSRRPRSWRHGPRSSGAPRAPEYIGDMPHTWIGAEFVTAIRRMLLRENGRTLELFRGAPDDWWETAGSGCANLPTAFGVVNLRARGQSRRRSSWP